MQMIISIGMIIIGTIFLFIAGVGIVRLPDLFMRMSASTKASTLGAGFTLIGVAVFFNDLGISSRAIATSIFLLITAPVAAHMIGRAAYSDNCPLWEGTIVDQLRGQYDEKRHSLASLPLAEVADDEEALPDDWREDAMDHH